ncbi:MAG: hypothetical protein HYV90_05890 [Candidatus Woesebacteria bacterium]|nr:MAG: hypothetical protein HYV90_05890 [Candidatus Woesebacteria bacterium]
MNKIRDWLTRERQAPLWKVILMYAVATLIALAITGGATYAFYRITGADLSEMGVLFLVSAILAGFTTLALRKSRN